MAYCQQEGKDQVIFVTREDHESPSNAELVVDDPNDSYEEYGLTPPSGEINWNCLCLGRMASGPCGEYFKSAFSCFYYSTDEIKGSDCKEQFQAMQERVQKHPDIYPQEENEDKGENKDEDKGDFYEVGKEGKEGEDGEEGEKGKEDKEENEEEEEDDYDNDSYYVEGEEDDVYYAGAEEGESDYYEEGHFYYEEEEDENIYYEIDYYGEDEEEEDTDVYYEVDYYEVEEEEEEEEPAKSVEGSWH